MIFGYARCSSVSQSLDIQIEALKAAGCEIIRSERKSGTTREGREELDLLLAFLRPGDVLMVVKIDRLARSISDLLNIARTLREKGASLHTVDGMSFDDTPTGTLLMQILGVVAEFENALRKERQLAGIAAAKLRGIYRGRPATIDAQAVRALKAEGLGAAEIARKLGISRGSVYRLAAPTPLEA